MFKFENNTLTVQKVETPTMNINVMTDIQKSYKEYITKTVHEDFQYLAELIRSDLGYSGYQLVTKVNPLTVMKYSEKQVRNASKYYTVTGYFTKNGQKVTRDFDLLKIPYMDDYGKVNVDGSCKVITSVLRSADDISYNIENDELNISMPHANIRLINSDKGIKVLYNTHSYELEDLIMSLMYEAGDNTKLRDIFKNRTIVNNLKSNDSVVYEHVYSMFKQRTMKNGNSNTSDLISRLKSDQYALKGTRVELNKTLSLFKRAVGHTLSREMEGYPAGTVITPEIVADLIRHHHNVVYVRTEDLPDGYIFAGSSQQPMLILDTFPAGTKNCSILQFMFPEYADMAELPVDCYIENTSEKIMVYSGDKLSKDLLILIRNAGLPYVDVKAENSSVIIHFSFEREIAGNYTVTVGDLHVGEKPDASRSYDEWIYYYNNPDFKSNFDSQDHLNAHDFIAIASLMGEIKTTKTTTMLDRDNMFLKKVLLVGDIFSETLRSSMSEFYQSYKALINTALSGSKESNPFEVLGKKWISKMISLRFLAQTDTINLIAEVSQVNHINTDVKPGAEVADTQRYLAMPYYGRMCPYETPAGKKLGQVNTKAIGARLIGNYLRTPYLKVYSTKTGIRISNNITWMSVKEEIGNKFGDILSLKPDGKGGYENNIILARIPNPVPSSETFIFKNIHAYELAGGYVNVFPEQFLSPTACLIPFACSNDPVRISYGLSQIKQSIYLHNSQKPLVRTPMHEAIMSYSDGVHYTSPIEGKVTAVSRTHVTVQNSDETQDIIIQDVINTDEESNILELCVEVGDKVHVGDNLAVTHKYPQAFVVRAPYDCYVQKLESDGLTITKSSSGGGWIDLETVDKIKIKASRINGQSVVFTNIRVSVGEQLHKGDIIADTLASRDGVYSPSRNALVAYSCAGYNYEDGVCATEKASVNYISIISHKIEKRASKRKYRYMNCTFFRDKSYSGPGSKVGKVMFKNKPEGKPIHTEYIEATRKVHGIPFEMELLEDNSNFREYGIYMLGFNKLKPGDKMAGMHGNKGVVSRVLKDSEALQLNNGMTVEFELNPCGVPSRMNFGQILECHLSLIAKVLGIWVISPSFNGATVEDISMLMNYAYDLANTDAIGDNVLKTYNRAAFDQVVARYPELPKSLHEHVWSNIANVIDWRNTFNRRGSAMLYDPTTDSYLESPVVIGFPYFNKLMQEADEKLNYRAGVLQEGYSVTNSQPLKGEGSAKGQSMAEMELMALVAYGANNFIDEIINDKSDNEGRRINKLMEALNQQYRLDSKNCTSRAVENLIYLLEGCGVILDVPSNIASVTANDSIHKLSVDPHSYINAKLQSHTKSNSNVDTSEDWQNMED